MDKITENTDSACGSHLDVLFGVGDEEIDPTVYFWRYIDMFILCQEPSAYRPDRNLNKLKNVRLFCLVV